MEQDRRGGIVAGMSMNTDKIIIIAVTLFMLLLLTFVAASTSYAAEQLSLVKAIEIAHKSNPGLKAAEAQIEAADANVLKAASGLLPRVSLSETWSKTDNPLMALGTKLNREIVTPSDFNPQFMNDPDAISNYNTRLTVMQPVFNGGREYIGRKQAELAREASVRQRDRTQQETVYNVIKSFYGVLLARANNVVAIQSVETSRENLKLAEVRFNSGAVLQSDVLRAKVQFAEVTEMLTRSEHAIKLASAALNYAMGMPQTTDFEVEGSLMMQELATDITSVLDKAAMNRPDLAAMDLNRRNAEKSVDMARTDYLPSLNLAGQLDWNSDRAAGSDARSWAVMATLQWNLFDGLVTRSKVKEAVAASSRIRSLEQELRESVQYQVRQAYYNYAASLDRIAATTSSVQEADEGLRIVQKRYETGMTTFVDVLGAESSLIRARTNALQAVYDNNLAVAELNLATGTL